MAHKIPHHRKFCSTSRWPRTKPPIHIFINNIVQIKQATCYSVPFSAQSARATVPPTSCLPSVSLWLWGQRKRAPAETRWGCLQQYPPPPGYHTVHTHTHIFTLSHKEKFHWYGLGYNSLSLSTDHIFSPIRVSAVYKNLACNEPSLE